MIFTHQIPGIKFQSAGGGIRLSLAVCTLLIFTRPLLAQEITDPQKKFLIEKRIEMIAEANEETEIDYTTLFDELNYLFDNPVDLNTAEKEQLQQLNLLTDIQVNNLVSHIAKNGKLISIYELQSIDGFDLFTIESILPFIKVSDTFNAPHISMKELLNNSNNQLVIRETRILEEQKGFKPISDSALLANPNSRYLGSPDKLYLRYRFTFGNKISAGFTAEKDAGEEFFKGTQKKGFDFYSAHLYLRNFGKIKFLALGDYQVNFGQGLTFWSGLAYAKTADAMNIKRNPLTLRPYVSAMENLFMRGAGTTLAIKSFEFTGFYSRRKIDASLAKKIEVKVDSASTDLERALAEAIQDALNDQAGLQESGVTSLPSDGFHRTPGEIAQKHIVNETVYGGNISYKKKKGSLGVSAVATELGGLLQQRTYPYNQFSKNTSENFNFGTDYNYLVRNLNFFGEAARSKNEGMAFLNGVIATLSPDVSVSLLHRYFQKDYTALYTNAVSETRGTNNEKGLYFGLNARLNSNFSFSGYIDKFEFPWLKSTADAPSGGVEYLTQLTYKPSKKLEIYARYRRKIKEVNSGDYVVMKYLDESEKNNFRINSSFKITESITLRNRVELLTYKEGNDPLQNGYLIYQDVMYKSKSMKFPFSASFRFAMFDTDSYDSRIYAFENEVLYAFSIPAYYYRGTRSYIILQYRFFRTLDVWLRLSQTYYSSRDVISSGLSEIEGQSKTEIKAQIRYRF